MMGTAQNMYHLSGVAFGTCFEECIGLPALPSASDSFRYWVVYRPRLKNYLFKIFNMNLEADSKTKLLIVDLRDFRKSTILQIVKILKLFLV